MIGAGVNLWDDPVGLARLLEHGNFYDTMDVIYLIDGRYKNRDDMPEHDPEYIEEFASKFRKIYLIRMYDALEIQKRNRYWDQAEYDKLDWMIVIDSDEYCEIDKPKFESSLRTLPQEFQCFPINFTTKFGEGSNKFSVPIGRLFKAPFNFRHKQSTTTISHGTLYLPDGSDVINQKNWTYSRMGKNGVGGIEMFHDKTHLSRERIIANNVFYNNNPNT